MVNLFINVYIYLGTRWHKHTGSVTEFWKYARLLNMVSVTGHYINSRPSVQAWMAFCCEFPAFLLPMAQKQGQKTRICSKWSPWSAGCGSWSCGWCFVRWLQFGRNLEELAHGGRPGHADILVLEYEEIAIPRPGSFLPRSAQV